MFVVLGTQKESFRTVNAEAWVLEDAVNRVIQCVTLLEDIRVDNWPHFSLDKG